MTALAIIIAAIAIAAALYFAVGNIRSTGAPEINSLRADIDRLRQISEQSSQAIAQLQGSHSGVQNSLNEVTRAIGETNRAVAQQLQSSSGDVTRHLSDVQKTFAGLQHKVGEMTEQARQFSELSRSVAELQNIMSAPKLRGGFGETQLETLLTNVFPREQFALQYRFPSGDVVDSILFLPQGNVAIDSKFPLENFRRITASSTEAE
jgi:DNA recombination protein RmuC